MSAFNMPGKIETNEVRVVEQPKTSQPQKLPAGEALESPEMTKRAKHHKKWNRRLKLLFCCLGYKKNKVSSVISIIIIITNHN